MHVYDCRHMIARIWLHVYDCRHMIIFENTHIWVFCDSYENHMSALLLIYESSYADTHMKYSYMSIDIWLHVYDCRHMTTHIWVQIYEYSNNHMSDRHMMTHIWVKLKDHMSAYIWSYVAVYDSQTYDDLFVYDTHIWVYRHMTLIYESISLWDVQRK